MKNTNLRKLKKLYLELRANYANRKNEKIRLDVSVMGGMDMARFGEFRKELLELIYLMRTEGYSFDLNYLRLQSIKYKKILLGPKILSPDYNNKCNIDCVFCVAFYNPSKQVNKGNGIEYPAIKKIIEQAYELGLELVRLGSDGEPLFSKDAKKILDFISQKKISLELLTNGVLLNEEILDVLFRMQDVSILVNLPAASEENYSKICNCSAENFGKVIANLKAISTIKKNMRKNKGNLKVNLSYVIFNKNFNELIEYIKLAKNCGVDGIYFKLAMLYGKNKKFLLSRKDIEELKANLLNAKTLARTYKIDNNIDELLRCIGDEGFLRRNDMTEHTGNLVLNKCYNGWFFARINSLGDYYICCRETAPIDNIKLKSYSGVVFSERFKKILIEGANGFDLNKKMWGRCNYCYHVDNNHLASNFLFRG